jgi:hypothetical protein
MILALGWAINQPRGITLAISHNNISLQVKYLNRISSKFRNFKQVGNMKWCFSCPLCGDSKRKTSIARGYVLESEDTGSLYYYCHNCHSGPGLPYFIKQVDPEAYDDYLRELLTGQNKPPLSLKNIPSPVHAPKPKGTSKGLIKLSSLPPDHVAKVYVKSRLIPSKEHYRLFYCPKFKTYVNSMLPGKFDPDKIGSDEARLVMPFISVDKKLIGLQGRSLDPNNKLRYISIMLDIDEPRLFVLDCVDSSDDIIVFEGPIDSLFIHNSIASGGGLIEQELGNTFLDKETFVLVYDNEPRSIDTIRKIEKAIKQDYRVCIWPNNIHEKDANDMIKKMVGTETNEDNILLKCRQLRSTIINNTYRGMTAQLKLTEWRKC